MGGPKKKVIRRAIATLKLLLLKRLIFALDPMAGDEKQVLDPSVTAICLSLRPDRVSRTAQNLTWPVLAAVSARSDAVGSAHTVPTASGMMLRPASINIPPKG